MGAAADQIRIEQDKLAEIRAEAAEKLQAELNDMQEKARARQDAERDGRLDPSKADDQRKAEERRQAEMADRVAKFRDQQQRDQAHKAEQQKTDEQRQSDQRKADQQKADDRRQEDIRAEARAKARAETEKLVKEGLERHVADRQEKIMAGSSTGPAMTPRVMNDPIAMAAALDHPALTDDEKLILSKAGYAVGEGWHNREAERKEQLMQAERDKRDDDRQKSDARPDREGGAARANGEQQKEGPQKQADRPDFFEEVLSKERDRSQADREKQAPEHDGGQQREGQRQEQGRPDYFEQIFSRSQDHAQTHDRTPEQRAAEAVQARDDAVSDVKENSRKDHEDQQVGETVQDKGERANLESTGKVTVRQAEEMTHGKGSKEHADQQFERWFDKHETQELDKAGVSRDPGDYEREDER
ncbi:hypothetical protein HF923_01235 [Acidithiobacillus ferriphilus]|uniref:hypothetical protein n=1 Tax=Acidithiobacillus ferriphilus TaxID=1689834 RepID=UPI001C07ED5A|nr:hypothetical protein [Acidithiobacillus ferriphilus]MBU2844474.1 hypothetical protein [Acidithiobacillus ferriphilus]